MTDKVLAPALLKYVDAAVVLREGLNVPNPVGAEIEIVETVGNTRALVTVHLLLIYLMTMPLKYYSFDENISY